MRLEKFTLFIVFFLWCNIGFTTEIKVCTTCKHQTIKSAIDIAQNGDVVTVEPGVYKEHGLKIERAISLVANGHVVVDGENKETIIEFNTDSFSIDGFLLKNVGQSYTKEFAAILVSRSNHFSIKNNTLENVFFGVLIEKSKNGIIEGNKVSGNAVEEASSGNGIHIWHSSRMTVRNNELFKLRDGIYFEFVKKSTINNNHSYDNLRYGLHFMFSNNDSYISNTFNDNGAGVAVMFSKYINMKGNTFKNNWGPSSYGLLLKEIYDAEIDSNLFIRNTTGINAEGSTRINYKNNNFENNGWAIKISGACYKNIFTENNFLNNSFDLSYNGQLNDNLFNHNYWSSYVGYDLDKDGIGDVPFRPVKLFSYIVNRTPETIVLLRSPFIDVINFSEKVSPIFTPKALIDNKPLMKRVK